MLMADEYNMYSRTNGFTDHPTDDLRDLFTLVDVLDRSGEDAFPVCMTYFLLQGGSRILCMIYCRTALLGWIPYN